MRRRIERSRARCQRRPATAPDNKQPSPKPDARADRQTAGRPALPLWRAAESKVV